MIIMPFLFFFFSRVFFFFFFQDGPTVSPEAFRALLPPGRRNSLGLGVIRNAAWALGSGAITSLPASPPAASPNSAKEVPPEKARARPAPPLTAPPPSPPPPATGGKGTRKDPPPVRAPSPNASPAQPGAAAPAESPQAPPPSPPPSPPPPLVDPRKGENLAEPEKPLRPLGWDPCRLTTPRKRADPNAPDNIVPGAKWLPDEDLRDPADRGRSFTREAIEDHFDTEEEWLQKYGPLPPGAELGDAPNPWPCPKELPPITEEEIQRQLITPPNYY